MCSLLWLRSIPLYVCFLWVLCYIFRHVKKLKFLCTVGKMKLSCLWKSMFIWSMTSVPRLFFHLVTTQFKKCPWLMFTKYNFLYLHIISEILLFDAFLPRNTWILIFLPSLTTFGLYFRTKFHLDNIFNNIFGFKSIISLLDFHLSYLFYSLFPLFSFLPTDQLNITFLIYN